MVMMGVRPEMRGEYAQSVRTFFAVKVFSPYHCVCDAYRRLVAYDSTECSIQYGWWSVNVDHPSGAHAG